MLDPADIEEHTQALIGQVLGGRYRLDAVLGIGAMGAVYRAYHTGLERAVALKLLHKDLMSSDEMRARFSREAAAISKLDHPNCVRVTDFGSDDEHQYLVMELLQGAPLSSEIGQPLAPLRALEIVDEVLAGLEHAHGHGLVHRDIKPDNVFLAKEGDKRRAKLLDFGIVKLQESQGRKQITQVGMIFGTPHFMSPEQAKGMETDARTDLYATGIVLYVLLGGTLPFDSDDPVKVLRQQIRDAPPPLPEAVPPSLRQVVDTLLAKEPPDRYPSATAAREALAAVRQELEPRPVEIPTPTPAPAPAVTPVMVPPATGSSWWPPSRPAQWIAGGVGALVLLVVLAAALSGDEAPADAAPAEEQAAAAREGLEALLGGKKAQASDDEAGREGDGPDAATPAVEDEGTPSEKALQASLASVDALIEDKRYDAARIMLGPQLEAHPDEAPLHWRMGTVLVALGGGDNRAAALDSYANAIRIDAALLDDAAFEEQLSALMDDAKLREPAVAVAIELLGTRADDSLLEWLNVQAKPLDHALRHQIMTHLQGHQRGAEINEPLQRALDLWQAKDAADPCAVFDKALDAALASPDSFLTGTLRGVEVPTAAVEAGQEPVPCAGAAEKLEQARTKHDQMFAGIDPVVPKAFRSRPKASRSSQKRRRR